MALNSKTLLREAYLLTYVKSNNRLNIMTAQFEPHGYTQISMDSDDALELYLYLHEHFAKCYERRLNQHKENYHVCPF